MSFKAVKRNKDDTKDSKWNGGLFRPGLVYVSFIPSKYFRFIHDIVSNLHPATKVKNRFQNTFTICNAALDIAFSNMLGKPTSSIIDYLIHPGFEDRMIDKLDTKLDGRATPYENAITLLCTYLRVNQ